MLQELLNLYLLMLEEPIAAANTLLQVLAVLMLAVSGVLSVKQYFIQAEMIGV